MADKCQSCGKPTEHRTDRYCKECESRELFDMEESGKLTPMPDISEHCFKLERDHFAGQRSFGDVFVETYVNPESREENPNDPH